ncbi:hypothetical protein HZC07_02505 [Candidatus Micrarchaeota archaeon]|nr:hypothetical protein [Candidatus Micrarchaeota archaeon]
MKKTTKKSTENSSKKITSDRVPTGISGLDKLIEGGFPRNSSIMVRGGSGTGKTIFCLQWLYEGATKENEPGIFLSFAESKQAVYNHGKAFNWDLEDLTKKGKFAEIRYEPHEVASIIEEGGGTIRDTIETIGAKRLVIDSLTAYQMLFESRYKANEAILSLFEILNRWNTTTLVTSEYPVSPNRESRERLGFLTDSIINFYRLREKKGRQRYLEVVKMRDTNHNDRINPFTICKSGVIVGRK